MMMLGGDLGDWSRLLRGVWDFALSLDMTITRFGMTPEAIEELIAQRVAKALANYEAIHAANALEAENGGNNGNGNPNKNGRGTMPVARLCTYQDFVKCQQLNFKGTEGVIDSALTWWNSHKRTIGVDAAFAMTWRDLMKLMTEVMVPGEEDRIERYVEGLPDNIQGNVMSAEPTRLQDFKRQNVGGSNVARAYMAGGNEGRVYVGPHPICNKCKLHHVGPCTVKCRSCGKIGHLTRDYKPAVPGAVNQRAPVPVIPEARGKAYAIGGGDANPGYNVVTSMFLLNNHYASVLFDSGVDRSFVSTNFSTLLDIILDTLDVSYAVELADGRIVKTNTLSNNHAVIVCDEKIVRIPFGDEILIVQGDRSDKGKKSTLNIISYTKTKKNTRLKYYGDKGCQVLPGTKFTNKETEVQSHREATRRRRANLYRISGIFSEGLA
ncbi:hypothetical protein Tco_1029292 [Tanacetum coccineum]|uniref:CCHC-type domain-containing protein n=1 Tax=Tanacetum coccineum TaxID=301880 RepID=A0ABQ5G308_9ASTR